MRTFYYISTNTDSYTDKQFYKESSELGLTFVHLHPDNISLKYKNSNLVYISNGEEHEVDPKAILYRRSISLNAKALEQAFISYGATSIFGKEIRNFSKFVQWSIFESQGIGYPKSISLTSSKHIKNAVEYLDNHFPMILKTASGTHGVGVFMIDSEQGLKTIFDYLKADNVDQIMLLQEYISSSYGKDIRVIVLNDEVLAAVVRDNSDKDFRSNVFQGATPKLVELTKEQEEVAINSVNALGLKFGGVDILFTDDKPLITEVNSPCDYSFVEKSTGTPITKSILKFLMASASK